MFIMYVESFFYQLTYTYLPTLQMTKQLKTPHSALTEKQILPDERILR